MTLPNCYRCGRQPCGCADGCTIYHGDCREILPELPKVDLVLTDPPYGISGSGKVQLRGNITVSDYVNDDELPLWWIADTQCDAAIVFTDTARLTTVIAALNQAGLLLKRTLIWDKGDIGINPRGNFVNSFESAVYCRRREAKWHGNGSTINVVRYNRSRTPFHPTQKPLRVISYFMQPTSAPGQTILDPFMGSGTTLRAAKDLGRKAIGIEIEEKYCEIAANRLKQNVFDFTD